MRSKKSNNKPKIKPCKCGHKARTFKDAGGDWFISCTNVKCDVSWYFYDELKEAIKAWNKKKG